MSLIPYHYNAACPCPCCISITILYVHIYAQCPRPLCMAVSMLHVHVHVVGSSPCQCCMQTSMSVLRVCVHVHAACPCPCCISMSMLHAHVHASCPCPCCISISKAIVSNFVYSKYIYFKNLRGHPVPESLGGGGGRPWSKQRRGGVVRKGESGGSPGHCVTIRYIKRELGTNLICLA
jgi:hypothetical protein